ncbi:MAG: BamA/TamA family outer membrane protein, partial [candidate division Zixibacteria bacterium]|nr:BamA/TamA family outer membrane protein [candidate division Zixibacteria bacterium]
LILALSVTSWPLAAPTPKYPEGRPANHRELDRQAARMAADGLAASGVVDSLTVLLQRKGYLDGMVEIIDGDISVIPGGQYRLRTIMADVDTGLVLRFDLPFAEPDVSRAMDSAAMRVAAAGHYYARLEVIGVEHDGLDVTLRVAVRQGPRIQLGRHTYRGLRSATRSVIDRYIPVDEGDVLSDQTVQRAEQGALSIPFVTFLPPVEVRPRPGFTEANLAFDFREKKQVYIFGGGGYIPDDPTGVVWQLDLRLTNLFGGGREARIRSERREKGRNLLDIDYRQPVFWLGVGEAGAAVSTRDYRDDFYEFGVSARYRTRLTFGTTTGLDLKWRHVEPAGAAPGYSAYTLGYGLTRTRLDDDLNPSRGTDLSMTLGYAYRRYVAVGDSLRSGGDVFNETRSHFRAGWYVPVIHRLVWHMQMEYRGLETGDSLPPVSELVLVGGPGSLRGYRNEQFAAQRAALGTIEPRLRFSTAYIFLFYDAAYVNRPEVSATGRIVTDEQYHWGAGAGFAMIARDRFLRLSLGWNPDENWDQPRVSIEFSTEL